jgi:serine protease Do
MRYLSVALAALAGALCTTPLLPAQSSETSIIVPQIRVLGGSYIGVTLTDIDADRASALKVDVERGVEVTRVQEGGPAEKAGIKAGDVLLSYNGENILGGQQLGRLVWETPQGRRVKMQYSRDGKVQTATVVTGAPQFRGFDARPDLTNLEQQVERMQREAARLYAVMDIPTPLIAWRNTSLGIECEPMNPQLAEYFGVKQGVLVRFVDPGSVAEKAGFKSGDVLVSAGDRRLGSPRDLTQCLHDQAGAGKTIAVAVMRNHKHMVLNLAAPATNPE